MKCTWCSKTLSEEEKEKKIHCGEIYENFNFCSEEHLKEFNCFLEDVNKNKIKFLLLILLGTIGIPVTAIIYAAISNNLIPWGMGAWGGIIVGGTLIRFPYCTPQTNQIFGVKKSINIARRIGWTFGVLGIVCFILFLIQIL